MSDVTELAKARNIEDIVAKLESRIDELESREAIRECLNRYSRGVDRLDYETLMSCYHPDAVDEHGFFLAESAKAFCDLAIEGARNGFDRSFYTMGTMLIDVRGDVAAAETYCISAKILHQPDDEGRKQMRLSGVRFLDRLERRNGEWKIARRKLMGDWGMFHPTPTKTVGNFKYPPDDTMPPLGPRDRSDPVYSLWNDA